MESLIDTFHLDIKLLIAQTINFAVVLAVLYFFAIKPLLGKMKERSKEIEKGLEDARKSEESLQQARGEYEKLINEAKKEANGIIEDSRKKGEEKKQEIVEEAKDEIEKTTQQEKKRLQKEHDEMISEVQKQIADIMNNSLEKLVREKVDKEKDEAFIKETLENIKNKKALSK